MKARTTLATLGFFFAGVGLVFAASPQMGTWKLDEARSKFSPGAARNHTVVYEAAGDDVKITVDGVDKDGTPVHNEWTGKFDRKDYPVTGDPNSDTRSYRKVNNRTLSMIVKKGGKVTVTGRIVVSADGRTRTVTTTGPDSSGKKVTNVAVYKKQVVPAAENWLGTWKLDLSKSKYSPGPAPKSLTLKFEATPDGIKFTGDGVGADGKATHSMFLSRFDGKDVPYEGNPDAETASPRKIDNNSYDNTWKKGGKETITANVVVSANGKTMTITQTGKNAKGEAVNNTIMYNKQ